MCRDSREDVEVSGRVKHNLQCHITGDDIIGHGVYVAPLLLHSIGTDRLCAALYGYILQIEAMPTLITVGNHSLDQLDS